jgi:hypothetical protein
LPCASLPRAIARAWIPSVPKKTKFSFMKISSVFLAALLAGCATAPPSPLTAAHPASPDAPEGARTAHRSSLHTDEITRKSHTLLSAAQREQEQWDKFGPVSGTPDALQTAPETKHEHP